MRRTTLTAILLALAAFLNSATAQLQLVPLSTFGTNNDGTIRPGDFGYPFLTGDGGRLQRGMAFNPATGHLIIVNRNPIGSETINIIDAFTGAEVGQLNQDAKSLGGSPSFAYNMIGVTEDGAIYVGNLSTSGSFVEYVLYRWADESSLQTRVYGPANPGGTIVGGSRWGDTLAVRGSGTSTEVLIAAQNGTLAAMLRPTDSSMTAFTATPLTTLVPSGAIGYGLTFGPGNTFYGKAASAVGNPLYLLSYDLNAGTAATLHVFGTDKFPGRVASIVALPASNLLAGIDMTAGTNADLVRLYDLANPANPPACLDRKEVLVWTNSNGIFSGSIAFGSSNVYALDADNGLVAYTITNGVAVNPAEVFGSPLSLIVQLTSNAVFSVGADGTPLLSYQWLSNSVVIPNATNDSFVLTNAQRVNSGDNYSVIVTNDYASVTSSVAILTVLESYGNLLVYEPFNYPVDVSFLGQGGWIQGSSANGDFKPAAGSLNVPYLSPATGNQIVTTSTGSPRRPIGSYSQGVLYFSAAMRITNLTTTASETTLAFATGDTATYPLKINIGCSDPNLQYYYLGLYKGTGTGGGAVATNLDGSTMLFTATQTVFVVGRYQFNPRANDDTISLWVNPDPSTFGANVPPTPTLADLGTGTADASRLDYIALRRSSGFSRRYFDEIRVGFAWSEVTPPTKPSLDIATLGTNVKLLWPTNISSGYVLQSRAGLDDPDGWQHVETPVVVQGGSNTVTVSATGTRYFRLKK